VDSFSLCLIGLCTFYTLFSLLAKATHPNFPLDVLCEVIWFFFPHSTLILSPPVFEDPYSEKLLQCFLTLENVILIFIFFPSVPNCKATSFRSPLLFPTTSLFQCQHSFHPLCSFPSGPSYLPPTSLFP